MQNICCAAERPVHHNFINSSSSAAAQCPAGQERRANLRRWNKERNLHSKETWSSSFIIYIDRYSFLLSCLAFCSSSPPSERRMTTAIDITCMFVGSKKNIIHVCSVAMIFEHFETFCTTLSSSFHCLSILFRRAPRTQTLPSLQREEEEADNKSYISCASIFILLLFSLSNDGAVTTYLRALDQNSDQWSFWLSSEMLSVI